MRADINKIMRLIKLEVEATGILLEEEVENIIKDFDLNEEESNDLKILIDENISSITYRDVDNNEDGKTSRIYFNEYKYIEDIVEKYDEDNYIRIKNGKNPIYMLIDLVGDNGVKYSVVKHYGVEGEDEDDFN